MTNDRLRRHFAALGAAPDVPDSPKGMSEDVLLELVETCARAHRIAITQPTLTRRLQRVAQDFTRQVRRELLAWARKHKQWMAIAAEGDDLFLDEGPYSVLMTLRNDASGDITDGRWDIHFKKDAVSKGLTALKRYIQQNLRRWSGPGGTGVLEEAILEAAEASKSEDRFLAQTHTTAEAYKKPARPRRKQPVDEDDDDEELDDEDDDDEDEEEDDDDGDDDEGDDDDEDEDEDEEEDDDEDFFEDD